MRKFALLMWLHIKDALSVSSCEVEKTSRGTIFIQPPPGVSALLQGSWVGSRACAATDACSFEVPTSTVRINLSHQT
jgi:hypothetical protein